VSRTGIAVGRFRLGKGLGLRRRQDRVQWWALQTSGSSDAPRQQRRRAMTAIRVVQALSPSSSSLRRWFEVLTDFARRVESRVGSPVPSGDGSRRRSAASRRCALPFGAGTGAGAVIISTVVSEVLDIFQASQGSLGHFVGRSGLCLHYHLPSAGGYVPATPADRVCVGCRVPPSRRARSWSRAYIITISLRSRLGHSGLGYFRGLGETPQPAETWVWARSARLREYLRAGVRVREGHVDRRLRFTLCSVGFRGRDQRAATRPATRRGRRLCAVRDAADLRSEAVQTAHGAALGQLVGELEQEFVRGWRSVSLQRFGAGAQKSHA